jgi:hypothetical protein
MSNSEVINASNQVILRHTFKKDLRSEGTEGATIQFYADAQYKQPIGNMVSFTVRDTSPSQATRVATLRTYDKVTGQPLGLAAINKGFVSTLTGTVGASLVGNDSASLISQGGGNLVAQGGGTLVAQGGGNIVQLNNGQALLPSSTIFTPSNFGTAISSNSYAALSALRDQSGNLIANGSGK